MLKYIEINNPTNKSITYLVQLDGGAEYSIKDVTINVPAKGEGKCPVEYFSRFSRVAKAQVVLRSSKMTLETSSVLVFNLVSDVENPVPKEIFQMEAPIYTNPPMSLNIDIKNPFPMRGKFTIILKNFKVKSINIALH